MKTIRYDILTSDMSELKILDMIFSHMTYLNENY